MAQQFTNNSRALLTASITNTATSIVIESAKADLFPVANVGTGSIPSANSWFKATLQDSTGAVEIVAVRTRAAGSGVLSNVIRGYEGTTALAFVVGTVIGIRITAEDVQAALGLPGQNNVFSGDNSFTGINEFTGDNTFTGNNTSTGDNSFTGNNSFTGTITAPTKAYGTSSTALATTAFVQAALQAMHPVGSIYTSTSSINPGTSFGFGTWVQFGAGRVLIGDGGGYSAGSTGGSADAVVVSHNHTAYSTVSDPGHTHGIYGLGGWYSGTEPGSYVGGGTSRVNNTINAVTNIAVSTTNSATGVSGTNANLQPYVVVYMWNRVA